MKSRIADFIEKLPLWAIFLSYFLGANLLGLAWPLGTKVLFLSGLLVAVCIVILDKRIATYRISPFGTILVVLIGVDLFVRMANTILEYTADSPSYEIVKMFISLLVLLLSMLLSSRKNVEAYGHIVVRVSFFLVLVGLVQWLASFIRPFPILLSKSIPPREYSFYGFYCTIEGGDSEINLPGLKALRFQGLLDEPGTFALLFLVTLFWYKIVDYKAWRIRVSQLAILVSLSFGSWLIWLLLNFMNFTQSRRKNFYGIFKKVVIVLILLLLVELTIPIGFFETLNFFISSKFGVGASMGNQSSFGVRARELMYIRDTMFDYPFGIPQVVIQNHFSEAFSVGYIRLVIAGGIPTLLIHIIVTGMIILKSIQSLKSNDAVKKWSAFVCLILIALGSQRMCWTDTYFTISLMGFCSGYLFRNTQEA